MTMDLEAGLKLKEEGMKLVEGNNAAWLAFARKVAKHVRHTDGTASADDVRAYLHKNGLWMGVSSAWGAIFNNGNWEFRGRMKRSEWSTNHARRIMVWHYVHGGR